MARQIDEALAEAWQTLENLAQMKEMEGAMSALSALTGGLPSQMGELSAAMAGFGEAHAANVQELAGEPDWTLRAEIRVGQMLHLVVDGAFDLGKIIQTRESTQGGGFESLLGGLEQEAAGDDFEPGMMGQVMDQLQKGRGMTVVQNVDVLKCHIPGAPGDAADTLQLSTEANIPLVLCENGLGFEFAPMLTIRNAWEKANIPTFAPLGDEIVVPLDRFENCEPFSLNFTPGGQEHKLSFKLSFEPLERNARD